jgi:hypothetical protein
MSLSKRHGGSAGRALDDDLGALYTEPTGLFHNLVAAAALDPSCDFRRRDLREMDFTGADLRWFDFAQSDLRGTGIRRAAHLDETTGFLESHLDPEDREWLVTRKSAAERRSRTGPTTDLLVPDEPSPSAGGDSPLSADLALYGGEAMRRGPYPGLARFNIADAGIFFGREATVERLVSAIDRSSLTVLVGPSGSGKSSIIWAGLVPYLSRSGGWRIGDIRIGSEPGANPFSALARALLALYEDEASSGGVRAAAVRDLAADLENGRTALRDVFARGRKHNLGRRFLLVADQFEEVFALVEDEARRRRFIDLLLADLPTPQPERGVADVRVIMALRADFYGRALHYRPLADALQGNVQSLGPMNRSELLEVIVRPAERAGVSFERGLVETLLSDVESAPGSLPLLQFVLRELWDRREDEVITHRSYAEVGGIGGALTKRAEDIFSSLSEADRTRFRQLFPRFVSVGKDQEYSTRVVERAELNDDEWLLVQRLAGSGLVAINRGPAGDTVELTHDAVVRAWPRLQSWIEENREFLRWRERLGSYIEFWRTDPSDSGNLLRGGMLEQARHWIAELEDSLSTKERDYIAASIASEQSKKAPYAAETQRRRSPLSKLTNAAKRLLPDRK